MLGRYIRNLDHDYMCVHNVNEVVKEEETESFEETERKKSVASRQACG